MNDVSQKYPPGLEPMNLLGVASRPEVKAKMSEILGLMEDLGKDIGQPQIIIPPIFFNFPIAGIEYTQATQFFRFNGKGSGNGSDNSVPLVHRFRSDCHLGGIHSGVAAV